MEASEILKEYFKLNDEILPKFCESIHDTISARHVGDYINKLTGRMRDELDICFENNSSLFDDLYTEAYQELSKNIEKKDINRIEDTNNMIFNLTTEWYNSIARFLEITKVDHRSKIFYNSQRLIIMC
jgi:flagellin-specific chaperone FliS